MEKREPTIVYPLIGHYYTTDKTVVGAELIGVFKTYESAQKMAEWVEKNNSSEIDYHYTSFEIKENFLLD